MTSGWLTFLSVVPFQNEKANLMTNKGHQKCFWRYTFSDELKLQAALTGPCTSVPVGGAGTAGVMAGGQKTR